MPALKRAFQGRTVGEILNSYIGFIKQADAGMAVAELGRQHGFSPASFYAWRAKYGGMEAEDAKRLKELEAENNRLKRLLAEAHLDIEALKVGFGVKR